MSPRGAAPWRSAGRSDVGLVRRHNEDAFLERAEVGLWAVADGLGGHADGAVASRMIVDGLAAIADGGDARSLLVAVEASVAATHERLVARQAGGEIVASTVVVLLLVDGHWAVLWAGDSRCYLLRGGVLQRLTRDHSYVQELVDRGLLAAAEARRHPYASRITRAVGVGEAVELDVRTGATQAGDVFLLCSDGLSGPIEEKALAAELARPPEDAVAGLVGLALAAGGTDNITAVVVAVDTASAVSDGTTLRPGHRH